MNIFVLSYDPSRSARYMYDQHVTKMGLEAVQMLCMAMHIHGYSVHCSYNVAGRHINHPCTRWAADTQDNFEWLQEHAMAIFSEYRYRYGRTHKSELVLRELTSDCIPKGPLTEFHLGMPDEFKCEKTVLSYRKFYALGKDNVRHTWKRRTPPKWWKKLRGEIV